MKKVFLFFVSCLFFPFSYVEAANPLQEVNISAQPGTKSITSGSYANNLTMREERKVGIGVGAGGALGFTGVNLELNLEDENATLMGFGFGDGYNTVHLQWKHSFEGQYLTPYFSAGYSRWYNTQERDMKDASYVLRTVLSDSTLKKGPFSADFLVGSLGLQYNELEGEWAGAGFYFEFNLLGSMNKSVLIPSGGLGAIYYF
ncbi:MAG: hypothetical protein AABY64_09885 [Bdellovibrionota bacterium]